MFDDFYRGKRVLVTGHTGFKGSWLSAWLLNLGADVVGYSLDVPSDPAIFEDIKLSEKITDIRGDIRDLDTCRRATNGCDYVFHHAALGSVPRSIKDPVKAWSIAVAPLAGKLSRISIQTPSSLLGTTPYPPHKPLPVLEV